MNEFFKKILLLSFCLIVVGFMIGQNPNSFSDFKQFLKSKEQRQSPKILKVITKNKTDNEDIAFGINKTNFGSFSKDIKSLKITQLKVESQLHQLFDFDANYSFAQLASTKDELGFEHTNYLVYYKGYLVDGQMVMIHKKDGIIRSINGVVKGINNPDTDILISDRIAFQTALNEMQVDELVNEYPIENVFVRLSDDENIFRLAKKIKIFSLQPLKKYNVYIDAQTGKVLKSVSLLPLGDVQCTAHTYYSGVQTITADSYNGSYRLKDNTRNITTYKGDTWNGLYAEPSANLIYTNSSTIWSAEEQKPAIEAHWGIEKTYDYYLKVHNRKSYDDKNGPIYNIYNPVVWDREGMNINAAALVGYGIMVYGRGGLNGTTVYKPFVSIDIAGHEFAHLVTAETPAGGLEYQNESGALNESFSDIFGICIDFYTNVSPNWTMGELLTKDGSFTRSMSDPSSNLLSDADKQPNTYKGNYWEFTSFDNGGVHTNSGVQNYWFYLLCEGGSGTNDKGYNYSVTPIGMQDAEKIAYRNLMTYLPQTAQHIDAYYGSLEAAKDLFGENSQQYKSVKDAWLAVGVDSLLPQICRGEKILTNASGTITDGSGDDQYKPQSNCKWVIKTTTDKIIQLTFTSFELENVYSNGNMSDYVAVYDGPTTASTLIGKYGGTTIPPVLRSTSNDMLVHFVSDKYVERQGFDAKYETVVATSMDLIDNNRSLVIYPNPTKDEVFVKIGTNQGSINIAIVDMLGRVVKTTSFQTTSISEAINVDVRDLSSGVYSLQITGTNFNKTEKLVINK
ncbi:MAG: M4 family metallopeptidase [Porphyromonadaceae bacterium]|nr:M4 family metallopeptidase [Porphyromonadaceae bacterium]